MTPKRWLVTAALACVTAGLADVAVLAGWAMPRVWATKVGVAGLAPPAIGGAVAPATWVWLFACGAAVTFFAAGLLGGRAGRRAPNAPEAPEMTPASDGTVSEPRRHSREPSGDLDMPTSTAPPALIDRVLFAETDARATRLELAEQVGRLQASERRVQKAEARIVTESAARATALADLKVARAECSRLRAENAELHGRVVRVGGARQRIVVAPAPPGFESVAFAKGGASLQALVDDLTRGDRIRTAVVADELGLVVAASGANCDELAAAGVVIANAGARAGKLLSIGKVCRVSVEDEDNVTIAVSALPASLPDEQLSIVTLGLQDAVVDLGRSAAGEPRPSEPMKLS